MCEHLQLLLLLLLDLAHHIFEGIVVCYYTCLVFGFVEKLKGLVLSLFEEIRNGKKFVVESDNLFLLAVLEFESKNIQYLVSLGIDVRCVIQLLKYHPVQLLFCGITNNRLQFICTNFSQRLLMLNMSAMFFVVEMHSSQRPRFSFLFRINIFFNMFR